jgi:thermolabile hemolysin
MRSIMRRTPQFEPLEGRQVMASLAPVAGDDSFGVGEDQVLTGNVIAGSTAGEDTSPAGLPLHIVQINGESVIAGGALALASGATLSMAISGAFRYDPTTSPQLSAIASGGSGSDAFRYTVAPAFSGLVVLGDSLSDQGQLFAATGGLVPPDPPYFQGRTSNGPVWIETLAPRLGLTTSLANNLSVSGATTGTANFHEALLETDLPGLADEMTTFITGLAGQPADPDSLYVVWAGANDLFVPFDDPAVAIGQAVTNLATTVGTLQAVGAQHILVMNLPDMGLTPYALATGQSTQLTALSAGFNATLDATLTGLGIDIIVVDVFSRFHEIVADPGAFGLSNVTHPAFDGTTVVGDPDQFFFWDSVHPTAAGHRLIAESVFDLLTDEADVSITVSNTTTPPRIVAENRPGMLAGQIELRLRAEDDSRADQTGHFAYRVDWGDGGPIEEIGGMATGVSVTHTFETAAMRNITLSTRDQDGDTSEAFVEAVAWGTEGRDRIEVRPEGRNRVHVRLNGAIQGFISAESIDRLVVFALGGNDRVVAAGVQVPLEIDGGVGQDWLIGGQADDVLRGGEGHDILFGMLGQDSLDGGAGSDRLFDGPGNDLPGGDEGELSLLGLLARRRGAAVRRF